MKKILFLLMLAAPLSIAAQKTAAKAAADIVPSFNVSLGDTMTINTYIIKEDTSVILIELIIRPDLGKPYFTETQKTDTLQSSRKLGVLEFYATRYSLKNWREQRRIANAVTNDIIKKAEEEKQKQDKIINREKAKIDLLKKDKN